MMNFRSFDLGDYFLVIRFIDVFGELWSIFVGIVLILLYCY